MKLLNSHDLKCDYHHYNNSCMFSAENKRDTCYMFNISADGGLNLIRNVYVVSPHYDKEGKLIIDGIDEYDT